MAKVLDSRNIGWILNVIVEFAENSEQVALQQSNACLDHMLTSSHH